jgi:hypothetical protein
MGKNIPGRVMGKHIPGRVMGKNIPGRVMGKKYTRTCKYHARIKIKTI